MKLPQCTVTRELAWKLSTHHKQCKRELVAFDKENTLTIDERYEKVKDIFVRDERYSGMFHRVMHILAKEQGWDDARVWCIMTMPTLLSVFDEPGKDLDFVVSVFRSCCFSFHADTNAELTERVFGAENKGLFRMSRGDPVLALFVTDVLLSASDGLFALSGIVYDPELSTLQRPLEDAEMLLKVLLKKKTLDEDDAVAVRALNTLQKNDQGRTMLASYLKEQGISQEAYANVLAKYRTCMHCKKRGFKYPKCSVCQAAYYCSKECQVGDWDEHKTKCKK